MAHSKRNTSLAFFTAHERGLLKSTWGSQATRLTRDSFLPFGSCRLCLLPSRSPVACASNGDIFCRECAMNNLLAQRKEIKRLEKDEARRRQEEADAEARTEEEARARAVQDFERVQTGVSLKLGGPAGKRKVVGREGGKVMVEEDNEADEKAGAPKGTKRKFELDEAELLRIARDERGKARKALDDERYAAARTTLPSFWVPSLTPSLSNADAGLHQSARTHKHLPTCPGSSKARPHTYTLKTLVTVQFSEEDGDGDEGPTRICPSCKKALSNSTKAMLAKPCGHVLCKPCVTQFIQPPLLPDPHSTTTEETTNMTCYVCTADLGPPTPSSPPTEDRNEQEKEKEKEKEKERIGRGLVQLSSEGTGFAGAGANVVKREGVAFQC